MSPGVAEQHGVRGMFLVVSGNRGQLDQITRRVNAGKLKPVVAEMLPLARAREAFEDGAAGHASWQDCAPGAIAYGGQGARTDDGSRKLCSSRTRMLSRRPATGR